MLDPIVYLNGQFLPQSQAQVSVLDRGFIYGDGIYEVIPAYHGKLFRLGEHLQRLQNSLDAIQLLNPMSVEEWRQTLTDLLAKNTPNGEHQAIYLQITRGVAKRDHAFPKDVRPTVFAMANPLQPVDTSILENGVSVITMDDIRWQYCHIKSIALLANVLLRQQAAQAGAAEALLIRNGFVTEGAASNVFVVRKETIYTPPKGHQLLPGITRDLVVELAQQHNLACEEREIPAEWLDDADEIWLSSSMKDVLPVTHINGQVVGDGKPGPVWKKMLQLFQAYKESLA